jgi:hypothetical protein
METVVLQAGELNLPTYFAGKIQGRKIKLVEQGENILIMPVGNIISAAKGMLRDLNYSTEQFMREKNIEKKLEDA